MSQTLWKTKIILWSKERLSDEAVTEHLVRQRYGLAPKDTYIVETTHSLVAEPENDPDCCGADEFFAEKDE